MKRSYVFFLLLLVSSFIGSSCHTTSTGQISIDDCDGALQQLKSAVTLSNKASGTGEWSTETDPEAGDCTTLYYVWYRSTNSASWTDPAGPDVIFTFSPTGFPPSPQRFSGTPPGASGSEGWWQISFAPTPPTTQTGNTTKYKITATLSAIENDDVEVHTMISYRHSPN